MRLLAPVDQQVRGNAMVTPSQRMLNRFHPVVRHWKLGYSQLLTSRHHSRHLNRSLCPQLLSGFIVAVKSKPVSKTGVTRKITEGSICSARAVARPYHEDPGMAAVNNA